MQIRRLVSAFSLAAAAFFGGVVATVHATPLFSDSFDYPAGALSDDGPPMGAPTGQGAWAGITGNVQVTAGSSGFAGFHSTGSKATINGNGVVLGDNAGAVIAQAGGPGGGTVWAAILISQASGASAPGGYAVLGLLNTTNNDTSTGLGMLDNENIYGLDNGGADVDSARARTSMAANSAVTWLVAKFDFDAGMEYIFVNPDMSTEPSIASAAASNAMAAGFQATGFNKVVLATGSNTASFDFDEVRIGTDFADLVPPLLSGPTPTVSVKPTGNGLVIAGETKGKVLFTRTGDDLSTDLTVNYKAVGSAKNGVDYKALSGQVVIPAGKASVKVAVKSFPGDSRPSKETIKIKLKPVTDGTYDVSSTSTAKLLLITND